MASFTVFVAFALLLLCACSASAANFEFVKGRTWIIGGSFTKITQSSGDDETRNNIAVHNGIEYSSLLKEGTNGPVRAVHVDLCSNIYVGGSFSQMEGTTTGPIVKYNPGLTTQTLVGKPENWQSINGSISEVRTITTNCAHLRGFCSCDVFVGGKFVYTQDSVESVHIAQFEPEGTGFKAIDLKASEQTKFDKVGGAVNAIYKKNWGSTAAVTYLWVGGDMGSSEDASKKVYFGRYEFSSSKWVDLTEEDGTVNGPVHALQYRAQTIGFTDELYVGGAFNFKSSGDATCQYVCQFNHATKKWITLGDKTALTHPKGPVYAIGLNGPRLFVAGDFANNLLVSSGSGYTLLSSSQTTALSSNTVRSLAVCGNYDLACKGDSAAVSGDGGLLKFYNSKKESWENFSGGSDGIVHAVSSYYTFQL